MSSDLTFLTNEPGKSLLDRFQALLGDNTRYLDCLVGYFLISGFHKLYPALEETEKIRILIGLKTDATVFQSLERAKEHQQLLLKSHAQAKEELPAELLEELEHAEDTSDVERGIEKFIQWAVSGKLQVRVYPSARIHAKVYILTFPEGHYDVGRVITGSSNFSLQFSFWASVAGQGLSRQTGRSRHHGGSERDSRHHSLHVLLLTETQR